MGKSELMGIKIDTILIQDLYNAVDTTIKDNIYGYTIGYTNLHGLYVATRNTAMSQFYRTADINYIDGMPIMWLLKMKNVKTTTNNRITFLDFVYDFLHHCQRNNYRILWIGAKNEILDKGINTIKAKVPGLQIHGIDGYKKDHEYLSFIDEVKPNIILLGMGMPRQESWVLANRGKFSCNVTWCIGATIDYIAGHTYMPPRWAGKLGFEWVFRFFSEPKRMWYRYCIEPFIVIWHLFLRKKIVS